MRSLLIAAVTGFGMIAPPVLADGPLFLRIRPNDDDAVAARARALREAVWARSDRRARIAIASVCTGCLTPLAPPGGRDGVAHDIDATGSVPAPSPPAGDP